MKYSKWLRKISVAAITGCMLMSSMPISVYADPVSEEEQATESIVIPEDAIYVSSVEDLLDLAEKCIDDDWSQGKTVVLNNDIDMTGVDFYGIPTFSGTFYGQGHVIRGFIMEQEQSVVGFFRYTQSKALIDDLHIEATIQPEGTSTVVGGIVGSNAGTIKNCTFTGTVSGKELIGGITGINKAASLIDNCTMNGEVYGNHYIGGITGENKGVIRNCTNKAKINTEVEHNSLGMSLDISLDSLGSKESMDNATNIGGIAGTSSGVIRGCMNQENVGYQKMGYNVGGIAGSQNGYIVDCVNYANIQGSDGVGGIVGQFKPNIVLEFGPDPMETMKNQIDSMTNSMKDLTNSLGEIDFSLSDGSLDMETEMQSMMESLESIESFDALESLDGVVNPDTGEINQDILDSFLNDFSNSFGDIYDENGELKLEFGETDFTAEIENMMSEMESMMGSVDSMTSSIEDMMNSMSASFEGLADTMGVSMDAMIGSMSVNMGMNINDISRTDTDADTIGKVSNCSNYGEVAGQKAVGGIAGNCDSEIMMSDDDMETKGKTSSSAEGTIRLVLRDCRNYGTIAANKSYAGGIAGNMVYGAVLECYNVGNLDALNANYVGGIVGNCDTFIFNCYNKSIIAGANYVGGITGCGVEVYNCYALVDIAAATEYVGAVLGYTDELPGGAEDKILNNFYCYAKTDKGGIDGINYKGATARIPLDEFITLETLDDMFKTVSVRFVSEGQEDVVLKANLGETISLKDLPVLTVDEGEIYDWVLVKPVTSETLAMGESEEIYYISEARLSNLLFDQTYEANFEAKYMVSQGEEKTEDNHSVILAIGAFDKNTSVELIDKISQEAIINDVAVSENWLVEISNIGVEKLHYRIPESMEADAIQLFVKDASGTWVEREYMVEGSYIIFDFTDGEMGFALAQAADYGMYIGIAVGVVVFILLFVLIKRKGNVVKKRNKE